MTSIKDRLTVLRKSWCIKRETVLRRFHKRESLRVGVEKGATIREVGAGIGTRKSLSLTFREFQQVGRRGSGERLWDQPNRPPPSEKQNKSLKNESALGKIERSEIVLGNRRLWQNRLGGSDDAVKPAESPWVLKLGRTRETLERLSSDSAERESERL